MHSACFARIKSAEYFFFHYVIIPIYLLYVFSLYYTNRCDYEWAKRMKFILGVMYGSLRRHSNSSKNWNTFLGLAELFKTMNLSGPTATLFDSLFLVKYIRWDLKFCQNLHSSHQFVIFKFGIYIFNILETKRFLAME